MKNGEQHISDKRIGKGLNSFAEAAMPLLKNILAKKGFAAADVLVFWEQIAGEETSAYARPQKLTFKKGARDGGVLEVAVPGGAFALELQHREPFIIEKINSYFGYRAVAKIKIVQDIGIFDRLKKQINQPEDKKSLVSEEEQNYIVDTTAGVGDEELKGALIRLGNSIFNENNKQVKNK